MAIPVVDLADFLSGDPKKKSDFVQAIGNAYEEVGFVAVKNHGIPDVLIADLYKYVQQFFSLPQEQKRKYEKIILDYMRRSFRVKSNKELIEMFVFMRRDLLLIRDDPFEENAFDAFNFLPWLASKIEKISYAEAARKELYK
jgi:isopenicillin N synthase-like dioxygenase